MDVKRALQMLVQAQVYAPAVVPGMGRGGFYIFSSAKVLGHGETIDAAMEDARAKGNLPELPPRPLFLAGDRTEDGKLWAVTRRGEVVAACNSRTMAARIANALNQYNPNERGF